jgi:hypothetical protein
MLVSVAGLLAATLVGEPPLADEPPDEQLLSKANIEAQIPRMTTLLGIDPRLSFN